MHIHESHSNCTTFLLPPPDAAIGLFRRAVGPQNFPAASSAAAFAPARRPHQDSNHIMRLETEVMRAAQRGIPTDNTARQNHEPIEAQEKEQQPET